MYKTFEIAAIQDRLDHFAYNQLIRLIKKKRNQCGFSWDIEGDKCVVVGPSCTKSYLNLTMAQIQMKFKNRKKAAPTQFTFFFTT